MLVKNGNLYDRINIDQNYCKKKLINKLKVDHILYDTWLRGFRGGGNLSN